MRHAPKLLSPLRVFNVQHLGPGSGYEVQAVWGETIRS